MNNADLKTMYTDAELFSMDRDPRIALLQYEWAVSWDEYVEKKRAEREERTAWIPETHNYGFEITARPPVMLAMA